MIVTTGYIAVIGTTSDALARSIARRNARLPE
jgi:hypothetical protein